MNRFATQVIFLLLCLVLPSRYVGAEQPSYQVIGENQQWQGEVVLSRSVLVAAGVELTILPGTRITVAAADVILRVEGGLLALGSAGQPVEFVAPRGWLGIELYQATEMSRLAFIHIDGAKIGLSSSLSRFEMTQSRFRNCTTAIKLLRQSTPTVASSNFEENQIAIDIGTRSQVNLSDNRFYANGTAVMASHNSSGNMDGNRFLENKQAVHLKHFFPGRLSGNVFRGNTAAILCDQTMASPLIADNQFVGNAQGVISLLASKPQIRGNVFRQNQMALLNNQLGSPHITNNNFTQNGIGIKSERRSAPLLERNRFEKNELALFCDYLSYPTIRQNNFIANGLAVRLGNHQSSAMESQGTSDRQMQQFLAESGRSGKLAVFPVATGVVDVSDNWWGKALSDDEPQLFFARRQEKWVLDEPTGVRYLRDRIDYSSWLPHPVADAGVEYNSSGEKDVEKD